MILQISLNSRKYQSQNQYHTLKVSIGQHPFHLLQDTSHITCIYKKEKYKNIIYYRFILGVHVVSVRMDPGVIVCVMPHAQEIDQFNSMLMHQDIIKFVIANRVQMPHFVMEHIG